MRGRWILIGGLAVLALVLAACGGQAVPWSSEPEQVDVTLSEFTVDSSRITFARGTTYRFIVTNRGQLAHEFIVVPPGHQGHVLSVLHVEADALPPGATMTQNIVFPAPGKYEMVCHLPGHFEAGMKLLVEVT
ncbi:MAG: hypothetical protein EXR55_05385 [Dehalococcoidia bacterium]|nr:hypothetical protein [Dehalococcoidia bacterium]